MLTHTIAPVFNAESRILILGSFPSVKSRETAFYYGHPQNRFWRMLADIYRTGVPATVAEKKQMLLEHNLALWDVIGRCEIEGSSDASIKNAEPNDIMLILKSAPIEKIVVNGKTAEKYYNRFVYEKTGMRALCLPSTSPANAGITFECLTHIWSNALSV